MSSKLIIRLLPAQIGFFWSAIKFVATTADEIDKADLPPYLNELLHSLLSDKAQCFVVLDEKRVLTAMSISRVLANKINGQKYLYIQCLYAFQSIDDSEWEEGFDFMRQFAEKEKCSYISFDSRNPRVWDIGRVLGCEESRRTFTLKLGGVL